LVLLARPAALYRRPEHPLLQQTPPVHRRRCRAMPGPSWCSTSLSPRACARCSSWNRIRRYWWELTFDNPSLLRDLTLCGDNLLFTWNSWLEHDARNGGLVNLRACYIPNFRHRTCVSSAPSCNWRDVPYRHPSSGWWIGPLLRS